MQVEDNLLETDNKQFYILIFSDGDKTIPYEEKNDLENLPALLSKRNEALSSLQEQQKSQPTETFRCRRSHLLEDFKTQRLKSWSSIKKSLNVIFLGKSAVDEGGPTREFFSGE